MPLTARYKLPIPASRETDWDVPLKQVYDLLDASTSKVAYRMRPGIEPQGISPEIMDPATDELDLTSTPIRVTDIETGNYVTIVPDNYQVKLGQILYVDAPLPSVPGAVPALATDSIDPSDFTKIVLGVRAEFGFLVRNGDLYQNVEY